MANKGKVILSARDTTLETPARCPICHDERAFLDTGVQVADGTIKQCEECTGYFLFPPQEVEYTDSEWTFSREEGWQKDVQIAEELAPKIVQYLTPYLDRPIEHVLEVGCGTAFMAAGFEAQGIKYTGIDVDATSIEFAKDKGIDAHCVALEDIQEAQAALVRKYDLIISSNVFEHLDDPSKAFANLRMICNGVVVVIVPNAEGLFARIRSNKGCNAIIQKIIGTKREIAYSIDGYWHNIAYTRRTLEYLGKKAGIETIEIDLIGINDPVFGFVQPNHSIIYRIASSVAALLKMECAIIYIGKLVS